MKRNRRELYAANIELASDYYKDGAYSRMRSLLEQYLPGRSGNAEDLRGFEWRFLWRLLNRDRITLRYKTSIHSMAVSPDGRTLAIAGTDRAVRLFDIDSGLEIASFKGHDAYVSLSAFAPDGRWLATASGDRTVKIWEIEAAREPEQIRVCRECEIRSIALSPDGKTVAAGDGKDVPPGAGVRRSITLWDIASAELIRSLEGHISPIQEVEFSPDGGKLASASLDGTARLWDMAALKESAVFPVADQGDTPSLSLKTDFWPSAQQTVW